MEISNNIEKQLDDNRNGSQMIKDQLKFQSINNDRSNAVTRATFTMNLRKLKLEVGNKAE